MRNEPDVLVADCFGHGDQVRMIARDKRWQHRHTDSREGGDGMISQLAVLVRQAPSFVMHTAYPTDGGWRVVEVWETSKQANDFFAQCVHPNLPPGIKPKRTIQELYSLVKV